MPESTPPLKIEIALTFDDGPDSIPASTDPSANKRYSPAAKPYNTTERILQTLKKNDIVAAFFVQTAVPWRMGSKDGQRVVRQAFTSNPPMQRHIIGIQNGNARDKLNHPQAAQEGTLEKDLASAKDALAHVLGSDYQPKYVRGPFGLIDKACGKIYDKIGLQYVFCDVDSMDAQPGYSYHLIQAALDRQLHKIADHLRVSKTERVKQITVRFNDTSVFTATQLEGFLTTLKQAGQPRKTGQEPVQVTFCQTTTKLDAILQAKKHKPKSRGPRYIERPYGDNEYDTPEVWMLIANEMWVPYLYLDSRGLPTIGVGHLIKNKGAYIHLPLKTKPSQEPKPEEKAAEFDRVVAYKQQAGFKPKMHTHRYYAPKGTKFHMEDECVKELLVGDKEHIGDKEKHKSDIYKWLNETPSAGKELYQAFPTPVQLALLDMVYNLGLPGLKKYKQLRKSVLHRPHGQWTQAAGQCYRHGPSEDRNRFSKELFQAAAALELSSTPPP